ncbi:Cell division protein FtsQ [Ascidiaceihabitans donghaensis]|uniref:Cell division protein FtsQ n=1 Tax=Ascidiaceihabitans donghaensis TaxID=1510460 RepID=A0A2R8BFI7_9RHOB|nr:cell division protein FtsQ/DivIB [Ascidiaceihabitans donghaensis]SPH21816.1 Cell division protein FtsQ [Ascidiaceihabitans donghaensis]
MQSLKRRTPKADPAPSRWSWRLQRLMLTPGFRFGLRVGVPFVLTLTLGTAYFANPERQQAIRDSVADTRAAIQERPEFMVTLMAIDGVDTQMSEDIRANLALDFPISSFDLDLEAMRTTITDLPPVAEAALRIRPGGVLEVDVTPRVPVAVWRNHSSLSLVDATGAHVAHIPFRVDRSDLPLIAGDGANTYISQALELLDVAAPLGDRLRGLVRMGERRWDVVLDRDQRILLPTENPVRALERVIALEGAQDVLSRDVARVDMRLGQRPTVQMNKNATTEMWRIRQIGQ